MKVNKTDNPDKCYKKIKALAKRMEEAMIKKEWKKAKRCFNKQRYAVAVLRHNFKKN